MLFQSILFSEPTRLDGDLRWLIVHKYVNTYTQVPWRFRRWVVRGPVSVCAEAFAFADAVGTGNYAGATGEWIELRVMEMCLKKL